VRPPRKDKGYAYLDPDSESSAALFLHQRILKSDLASGRSVLKLTQNNNHTVNTPLSATWQDITSLNNAFDSARLLLVSVGIITPQRRLGGIIVSVLATGPKGRGSKPGRGDGF
jgi:hypothetical protein